MKKLVLLTTVLALMLCMVPSLALATPSFYSTRASWIYDVVNYADVDLDNQVDDGTLLSAGSSINLPEHPANRTLSFDRDLMAYQVPTSWRTWSDGNEPRVLYTMGGTSVTGNFSGPVHAFGVEMEPNPLVDVYLMILFADGTELRQLVSGDSGAAFFGFRSDSLISSLTMTSTVDFAFGRMVVDAAPVPEPSTLLLLGGGILGLVYYGKRRRSA